MQNEFINYKGLNIAHINTRSLLSKKDSLQIYLDNSNLSILCISETWLNRHIPDNLTYFRGYNIIRNDRKVLNVNGQTKNGGGVAILIQKDLACDCITMADTNTSNKDAELLWVVIRPPFVKPITICAAYRPPTGSENEFTDILSEAVELACGRIRGEIFVLGDFNLNFLNTRDNHVKYLKDILKNLGLTQLIKDPTRSTRLTSSLIDLIFTNSNNIQNCGVKSWNISDHDCIFVNRKHIPKPIKSTTFRGRTYRNFNKENFCNSLRVRNWDEVLHENNPNKAWLSLISTVEKELDSTCPIRDIRIKKLKDDWVDNELLERIHHKDSLLKRAKKSRSGEDWARARVVRNEVNRLVQRKKSNFIKEQLNQHKGDYRKYWRTIRQIVPSKKSQNNKISLIELNSAAEIPSDNIPNRINDYFATIGPKLAESLGGNWVPTTDPKEANFEFNQVTLHDFVKIINEIDVSKSSAIDNVSSYVLKLTFQAIPHCLLHICNMSLMSGVFPNSWKCAYVTPLDKGGLRKDVSNLRPVSLLPLPGKLLEKIVHQQTYSYLDQNNILTDCQGGFRPNHSTVSTVAELTDMITDNNDKNQVSLVAYLDFSKAFDTIDHNIFIKKIKHIGFSETPLKWFDSYLKDRSQIVIANNTKSMCKKLTTGVPQGSILGPLAFLLYINDLVDNISQCKTLLYADDTILLSSHQDVGIATTQLQNDLTKLDTWCFDNKLSINYKKTKTMIFGPRHLTKKTTIDPFYMKQHRLEMVDHYKYLGITLDKHLTFNLHLSNVI